MADPHPESAPRPGSGYHPHLVFPMAVRNGLVHPGYHIQSYYFDSPDFGLYCYYFQAAFPSPSPGVWALRSPPVQALVSPSALLVPLSAPV